MNEGNKQWMLGVIVGVVLTSLIVIALNKLTPEEPVVAMPKDVIQAYNMGIKDALKTNPPSLELEQTCLNMWANKQPKE